VWLFLYGCETWSHTLREAHRLAVLENRMLGKMFGPKMVAVQEAVLCIPASFISTARFSKVW
jgi:hypothetical protein